MKYAMLIDAGFLKRKLGSQAQPLGLEGVGAFLARLRAHEAISSLTLWASCLGGRRLYFADEKIS